MTITIRRPRPLALLAALAVAGGVLATTARAQDTSGTIASPMTSRDLDLAAARLELSVPQREQLESLYADYVERVAALTRIEPMLGRAQRVSPERLSNTEPGALRDAIRDLDERLTRIAALDNGLFDAMTPMLSDAQIESLQLVRKTRDRTRHGSGPARLTVAFNAAALVDLAMLYRALDLTSDERARAQAAVDNYERTLGSVADRMHQASRRMLLDLVDATKAERARIGNVSESMVRQRLLVTLKATWTAISADTRRHLQEMSDLNRRAVRELAILLPAADADDLQSAYVDHAYPGVPSGKRGNRAFRALATLGDLPRETHQDAQSIASQFRRDRDRVIDQAIEIVDDENQQLGWLYGNTRRHWRSKLGELGREMSAVEDASIAALRDVLGPEHTPRLTRAMAATPTATAPAPKRTAPRPRTPTPPAAAPPCDELDRFVPPAIAWDAIDAWARRAGLTYDETSVLFFGHEEYLESWQRVRTGDLRTLSRDRVKLDRDLANVGVTVSSGRIAAVAGLRDRVLEALRGLDRTLLDDIRLLIPPNARPAFDAFERQRERAVYRLGADEVRSRVRGRVPAAPSETNVDMGVLVAALPLDDDALARARRALADYESSATDVYRARFELARRHERSAAEQILGQTGAQRQQVIRDLRHKHHREMERVNDPIIDLNRATIARLADELPEEIAGRVQSAYDRAAYPDAYDLDNAADRYLAAALRLSDLSSSQRSRITDVFIEYGPSYEAVCGELIAARTAAPNADERPTPEDRRQLERLQAERDALNDRTLRRLRLMLDVRQQAAIGLAPDDG